MSPTAFPHIPLQIYVMKYLDTFALPFITLHTYPEPPTLRRRRGSPSFLPPTGGTARFGGGGRTRASLPFLLYIPTYARLFHARITAMKLLAPETPKVTYISMSAHPKKDAKNYRTHRPSLPTPKGTDGSLGTYTSSLLSNPPPIAIPASPRPGPVLPLL